MGKEKINWSMELCSDLLEQRKRGKSLSDLKDYLYSKTGISISQARISQVLKSYWNNYLGEVNDR